MRGLYEVGLTVGQLYALILHALQLFFNQGDLTAFRQRTSRPNKEEQEEAIHRYYTSAPTDYSVFLQVTSCTLCGTPMPPATRARGDSVSHRSPSLFPLWCCCAEVRGEDRQDKSMGAGQVLLRPCPRTRREVPAYLRRRPGATPMFTKGLKLQHLEALPHSWLNLAPLTVFKGVVEVRREYKMSYLAPSNIGKHCTARKQWLEALRGQSTALIPSPSLLHLPLYPASQGCTRGVLGAARMG